VLGKVPELRDKPPMAVITNRSSLAPRARWTTGRALLYATLVVGTLDALDAIVFFGIRSGAPPIRIFQSIAAGLLGRPAATSGGIATALLGAALHYFIAFAIVATFFVASRYIGILRRAPIWSGLLYGVAAYLVMNVVVVPLSAAGSGRLAWPLPVNAVLINGLLIHMFGVGLPSSLFAHAAR
jgi:uncharacterized membrane protein YagU involved in acid resistance